MPSPPVPPPVKAENDPGNSTGADGGSGEEAGGSDKGGDGALIAALVTICLLLMAAAVGLLILYLRGQERGEEKEAPEPIAPTTYDSDVTPRERLEQRRKTMKEVRKSVLEASDPEPVPRPGLNIGEMAGDPQITAVYLETVATTLRSKTEGLLGHIESSGFTPNYRRICTIGLGQKALAAVHEHNQLKNRYLNIIPYDHSRVRLPVINNDPTTDYINANWIDGYHRPRAYIATQGPVPNAFISFWRMIWEYKVELIVMVTNEWERGRMKCHRYWPELPQGKAGAVQTFGQDITVTHVLSEVHELWVVRTFNLKVAGWARTVQQIAYTVWPDHGVPNDTTELLLLRTAVREMVVNPDAPLVVHCSAGVGRTGTFIGVDRCLMQVLDMGGDVNVDAVVGSMRKSRSQMVQTEEQYMCIHSTVLDAVNWLKAKEWERSRESRSRRRTAYDDHAIYDNVSGVNTIESDSLKLIAPAAELSAPIPIKRTTVVLVQSSDVGAPAEPDGSSSQSTSPSFPGYQIDNDDQTLRLQSVRRANPLFSQPGSEQKGRQGSSAIEEASNSSESKMREGAVDNAEQIGSLNPADVSPPLTPKMQRAHRRGLIDEKMKQIDSSAEGTGQINVDNPAGPATVDGSVEGDFGVVVNSLLSTRDSTVSAVDGEDSATCHSTLRRSTQLEGLVLDASTTTATLEKAPVPPGSPISLPGSVRTSRRQSSRTSENDCLTSMSALERTDSYAKALGPDQPQDAVYTPGGTVASV